MEKSVSVNSFEMGIELKFNTNSGQSRTTFFWSQMGFLFKHRQRFCQIFDHIIFSIEIILIFL